MNTPSHVPTVVVGVTGCIAAYKACELVRSLVKRGCKVKVVMTANATRFVGAATFRALTSEPVAQSLWDDPADAIHHISLAQEADVFVVAPATANMISKIAVGRADDLLTTAVLATTAPIVVAPAMNVHMWRAEPTVANMSTLRARGITVVEPATGELACGEVGEGRLADVDDIVTHVMREIHRVQDLAGVRVLVTSGPTREPLDPVRFLTNASSGLTGFAIAEEAARRGAVVDVVSGPVALPDPCGSSTRRVTTAAEMADAVEELYPACDVVVAAAAVSDFRPAVRHHEKVKKDAADSTIALERTTDILATLGTHKDGRLLVGFAAETEHVIEYARSKLVEKNLDLVVANDVSDPSLGFGSLQNCVWLVTANDQTELPVQSKRAIAQSLWDRIAPTATDAARNRRSKE